jgi:hypothetical protein
MKSILKNLKNNLNTYCTPTLSTPTSTLFIFIAANLDDKDCRIDHWSVLADAMNDNVLIHTNALKYIADIQEAKKRRREKQY